jgi:hypothetical protein
VRLYRNLSNDAKKAAKVWLIMDVVLALLLMLVLVKATPAGLMLTAIFIIVVTTEIFIIRAADKEDKFQAQLDQELEQALEEFAQAERKFYNRRRTFSNAPHLDLDLPAPNGRVYQVLEVSDDGSKALLRVSENRQVKQKSIQA